MYCETAAIEVLHLDSDASTANDFYIGLYGAYSPFKTVGSIAQAKEFLKDNEPDYIIVTEKPSKALSDFYNEVKPSTSSVFVFMPGQPNHEQVNGWLKNGDFCLREPSNTYEFNALMNLLYTIKHINSTPRAVSMDVPDEGVTSGSLALSIMGKTRTHPFLFMDFTADDCWISLYARVYGKQAAERRGAITGAAYRLGQIGVKTMKHLCALTEAEIVGLPVSKKEAEVALRMRYDYGLLYCKSFGRKEGVDLKISKPNAVYRFFVRIEDETERLWETARQRLVKQRLRNA